MLSQEFLQILDSAILRMSWKWKFIRWLGNDTETLGPLQSGILWQQDEYKFSMHSKHLAISYVTKTQKETVFFVSLN